MADWRKWVAERVLKQVPTPYASARVMGAPTEGLLIGSGSYYSATAPSRESYGFLRAYSDLPWLKGVCSRIAFSVAETPWHLYRVRAPARTRQKSFDGARILQTLKQGDYHRRKALLTNELRTQNLEMVLDHPLIHLLQTANSIHTGMDLRRLTQLYMDLTGECFWLKERNAVGAPVRVWPIPPTWIRRTPTPREPTYDVRTGTWMADIQERDMLWLCDHDVENPYGRGKGYAEAVDDELEIDNLAAKMSKQVFYNGAKPDVLVSPKDGVMQESEVTRLQKTWTDRLQGFRKGFQPFFLSKAVETKEFKPDFQALEFTSLRKHQRDVVMQVFGIPPEIMGVLANSNRATIEAADYLYALHVVRPRLEFLRSQLQQKLVPDYDTSLVLDYDSPVSQDSDFRLKAMQARPEAPTINEWRVLQGLDEFEDEAEGTRHVMPANMNTVDKLSNAEKPSPPSGGPGGSPFGGPPAGFPGGRKLYDDLFSRLQDLTDEELQEAIDRADRRES